MPRKLTIAQQQKAEHSALISLIVTKCQKIQKEIGVRNRRLKDVYKQTGATIEILENFQDVDWYPPKSNSTSVPIDSSTGSTSSASSKSNMNGIPSVISPTSIDADRTTSSTPQSAGEEGKGVKEPQPDAEPEPAQSDTFESSEEIKDDLDEGTTFNVMEITEESMHPAVEAAIAYFGMVLTDANRTQKIVEIALECVILMISNRYVSGTTTSAIDGSNGKGDTIPPSPPPKSVTIGGGDEKDEKKSPQDESKIFALIENLCACADSSSDIVQTAMIKALLALMTSPVCNVQKAAMLRAVRAVFHVYLVTKHTSVKDASKATLLDMLRSVFNRMEAYDIMVKSYPDNEDEEVDDDASATSALTNHWDAATTSTAMTSAEQSHASNTLFASRFHTDGYLLFRALCKLSTRPLPEDGDGSTTPKSLTIFASKSSDSTPLASNSKILSLELILSVVEHCGPAFQSGEKFVYAVQNYLCVSLLKNCMSNNTRVAHLSLKIFLLLVCKFKDHLKSEIEVFITNIFLPVLESPNSPIEQKQLVLEALRALCADPMILTQIFLNYDCDFDAVNLYRKIVHQLTSMSVKFCTKTQDGTPNKMYALSIGGLEVLVVALRAFLKALHLPGGDDDFESDETGHGKFRGTLQLDIGMAAQAEMKSDTPNKSATTSDEVSIFAQDIQKATSMTAEEVAGKIVDAFDRKQLAQQNFELGCVKFTLSLKQGLLFFIEHGFFQLNARDLALFLHEHKEKLDKTQIGELLGKEPDSSFVKDEGTEAEKGGEGFFLRVLYHYVDAMDFAGLEFDEAIRSFLSGFRLPGEAQKIDRIMEKFAERFTRQNEDIFPSADTAFILAFSVIMLQTDLHNPSIKPEKRMTVESFIRNNRGIVDGGDLPDEFLTAIFKRVQSKPFTLKEDDDARNYQSNKKSDGSSKADTTIFFGGNEEEKRRERFRKERAQLMASSELLFEKGRSGINSSRSTTSVASELTQTVSPSDVVKPMVDITWGPLIGALSQLLEMTDDDQTISLCLNAILYSVRITSNIRMGLARDTFISTLAKFTTLGSIKEMKRKNIECIRTLLSIAVMDGEYLGDSWTTILQCISQLGRLQLYASGVAPEIEEEAKTQTEEASIINLSTTPSKKTLAREMEENNGKAVLEAINEVLIEKVFSSSVKLSDATLYQVVESLVAVSDTEIDGDLKKGISGVGRVISNGQKSKESDSNLDGHRTFSLQKLVEVADLNMNIRPRLSWSKMWNKMADHLVKIGSHKNASVSMYAIDALRQLSYKFLEKPELADFNFQRLFLRPFLLIIKSEKSREDIRELILQCVDNFIRSMSKNIRSGWKIFFSILTISATDPSEKINTMGLSTLQYLIDEHLDIICKLQKNEQEEDKDSMSEEKNDSNTFDSRERNANADDFVSLCRASLSFIQSEKWLPVGLSLRALCHAACYADLIVSGKVLPPVAGTQVSDPDAFGYTYDGLNDSDAEKMVLWRPILDGLAKGMSSTVPSSSGGVGSVVQRGSVMTLRAILLRHGEYFSCSQWRAILEQVILPAMQTAAENDDSRVRKIVSESPTVSNLDFLSDPLCLPPHHDDEGLKKFAYIASNENSAPPRLMGEAELLVEASFADLRHGGSGDLRDAFLLLNKDVSEEDVDIVKEPFPDSWVSVTAPIALGMLSDLFSEIIINYGAEGREKLWPILISQMQQWAIGCPSAEDGTNGHWWTPCEAIVRVGCKEISHLLQTSIEAIPRLNDSDGKAWINTICLTLADVISTNVEIENHLQKDLIEAKRNAVSEAERIRMTETRVQTSYGVGHIEAEKLQKFPTGAVTMYQVKLDFGATLFCPLSDEDASVYTETKEKIANGDALDAKELTQSLMAIIRPLKVRCIASYCLQQSLFLIMNTLSTRAGQEEVSALLDALDASRSVACKASLDEDLSQLFKEAFLIEFGEGVNEGAGGFGHRGSSEMFFLTQEAGANNSMIDFLSLLYCPGGTQQPISEWDTMSFSEPILMDRISDVLEKFVTSEKRDGLKFDFKTDPNLWRMACESGGKFALYCTSFSGVVLNILNTIDKFSEDQFDRQKHMLFPILCNLVRVQSHDIRNVVANLFNAKIAPLLGLSSYSD